MTIKSFDMAYAILPNGDIVTSDGKPRKMSSEHADIAYAAAQKAGREPHFRAPTAHEQIDWNAQHDALIGAFREFKALAYSIPQPTLSAAMAKHRAKMEAKKARRILAYSEVF